MHQSWISIQDFWKPDFIETMTLTSMISSLVLLFGQSQYL